jgi:hypothetical protein
MFSDLVESNIIIWRLRRCYRCDVAHNVYNVQQQRGHQVVGKLCISSATSYLVYEKHKEERREKISTGLCYKHNIHGQLSVKSSFLCYKPQIYGQVSNFKDIWPWRYKIKLVFSHKLRTFFTDKIVTWKLRTFDHKRVYNTGHTLDLNS